MELTAKDLSRYQIVPIDTIKPYEKNPYKMTPETRKAVEFSIEKYGFNVPLVVREGDRVIASGNKRWAVMKEMGYKNVIVHLKPMNDEDFKGYLAADNKTNSLASIDDALMDELFEEIGAEHLKGMGFGDDEIEARLAADLQDISNLGELEISEVISSDGTKSSVKMLQLHFTEQSLPDFMQKINDLSEEEESVTDTIVRITDNAHEVYNS